MFNITPIDTSQIPSAKQVIKSVWKEFFEHDPRNEVRTFFERPEAFLDLDDVQSHYFSDRGVFLVLIEESHVIGTGGIRRRDNETCELKNMYLLPEYRGMKLGRRLGEALLHFAREANYKKVTLGTNQKFTSAHQLYLKLGFKFNSRRDLRGLSYYMELFL